MFLLSNPLKHTGSEIPSTSALPAPRRSLIRLTAISRGFKRLLGNTPSDRAFYCRSLVGQVFTDQERLLYGLINLSKPVKHCYLLSMLSYFLTPNIKVSNNKARCLIYNSDILKPKSRIDSKRTWGKFGGRANLEISTM